MIDFNTLMDQASAGFDPVPDGDYDVEVVSSDYSPSSTQKPMWKVKFNVLAGPYANRKIFNNFTLSTDNPNALGFFFRHMAAMGLNRDYFASNPPPEQIAQAMVGRRCRLKVGTREWQGQPQNDVKAVLPPVEGGVPGQPGVPAAAAPQQPGFPPAPQVPQQPPAQAPQPGFPPGPAAPQQPAPAAPPQPGFPTAPQAPPPAPTAPAPQPQQPAPQPAPPGPEQYAPQPAPPQQPAQPAPPAAPAPQQPGATF